MSFGDEHEEDYNEPLQTIRLIHDKGKIRLRLSASCNITEYFTFLLSLLWVANGSDLGRSLTYNLTLCPDVAFSLTAKSKVCVGGSVRIGWTAPRARSDTTAICFFRGNNTLPHGCQAITPLPPNPCQQISSFMGVMVLTQSLPFWSALTYQVGLIRAIFASDCDETKASDWISSSSSSGQFGKCTIHGGADLVVIEPSSTAAASTCDGTADSGIDSSFTVSLATKQVLTMTPSNFEI